MSLFKNKKCIGWDIGSSGVRAVELADKNGRVNLNNFAHLSYNQNIDLSFADEKNIKIVIETLRKILYKAKFSTLNSYAVIPGFYSYNKVINFNSKYSGQQIDNWLNNNISSKAFSGNNILLDWQLLSKNDKQKTIFASAVSRSLVDIYKKMFKDAGLNLLGIETSYNALIRSLFGTDNTNAIIIDIGSKFSDMTIIKNNIPYATKSMKYGGQNITDGLSSLLKVSLDQADQIKKDAIVVDKKLISKVKKEINILLEKYYQDNQSNRPDKILLTGGELRNDENCKLFKKHFNIDAYLANPWSRILYNVDLKKHLDKISPNFAVAVGSAMKSF